jgi:predicted MPP superfamily phosphohydrolase
MSVAGLLLFLGAWVGHAALLVASLNWWYAQPLRRPVLHALKRLYVFLGAVFPVALWLAAGLDLAALWPGGVDPGWRVALFAYLLLCWAVTFVALPALTVFRLVRGKPAVLLSNHTRMLNVADRLGYRPAGRTKYRHLARLPLNECFRVDFAERTLRLAGLPAAWDGLSILHLSDLHLRGCPDKGFYQCVMDVCRDWEPDLVAVTGDIVDSHHHHRWVVPVLGRLRWKVAAFAVLGNHDYWHDPALVRRRLRRIGFRVLGNAWEQLEVRGEPMVVIGHEGPWFRPGPDLTGCPSGPFRLCLSHTPDNIGWARAQGVGLMVAGHNHGGQIRFPLFGSVFVPSRYGRRYDCGVFHEPPTLLHVSRGLAGKEPLRYFCRPEVTKIVLKRSVES